MFVKIILIFFLIAVPISTYKPPKYLIKFRGTLRCQPEKFLYFVYHPQKPWCYTVKVYREDRYENLHYIGQSAKQCEHGNSSTLNTFLERDRHSMPFKYIFFIEHKCNNQGKYVTARFRLAPFTTRDFTNTTVNYDVSLKGKHNIVAGDVEVVHGPERREY